MSDTPDELGPEPQDNGPEKREKALDLESECLAALLDLDKVQDGPSYGPARQSYPRLTGRDAPDDLRAKFRVSVPSEYDREYWAGITPPNTDVIAIASITWDSEATLGGGLRIIDFTNTVGGLKAYIKTFDTVPEHGTPSYSRMLEDADLRAIIDDVNSVREYRLEVDSELLKLGPLTEEAGANGRRRFHVGDILSVLSERLISPRNMVGLGDLLTYMVGERPAEAQMGRFAAECRPRLMNTYGKVLKPYIEELDGPMPLDQLGSYRYLARISEELGTSMLEVEPIDPSRHAHIDRPTELELDYGPEIMAKTEIRYIDGDPPDRDQGDN